MKNSFSLLCVLMTAAAFSAGCVSTISGNNLTLCLSAPAATAPAQMTSDEMLTKHAIETAVRKEAK